MSGCGGLFGKPHVSLRHVHAYANSGVTHGGMPEYGACTNRVPAQAVAPAAPLGVAGWAALGGFLAGFAMETVADAQKFAFKNKHPDRCGTPRACGLICKRSKLSWVSQRTVFI